MTWIYTLMSGMLIGFALPSNDFGVLGWIALIPLFLAARRSGPIKSFVLGMAALLIAATFLILPLHTPEEWGNAGGGCLLFAILIGWVCAFASAMKTASPWKWTLAVAAAGVLGEWLAHGLFPLYFAMSQWRNPYVMPVASWVGIWGVSFLIYALNAGLAFAVESMLSRREGALPAGISRRAVMPVALGMTLLVALVHLYGGAANARETEGRRLRVAAIQPESEDPLPLLRAARSRGAEVAVWPELALSEPLERDLRTYQVEGLYQVIGYAGEMPEEGLPENYAALVSPAGEILGRYGKIRLFGSERFVHRAGSEIRVVESPLGRAGLAICYDTMFTEVVRSLARRGAQIALVPNLDPWASRGALHALHAAVTVFRAAENGIPLVRSEYRGYSMIVDGRGRILQDAGLATPSVVVADVTLPSHPGTLYTRLGDVFPPACLLLLVLLIGLDLREDRRKKAAREREFMEELFEGSEEPMRAG
ncbi:MAG: hypothetical protein KY468_00490 [Armatimonadetes bacterium]|nr:hypothetical protein [Armatimonadota bacterium]